MPTSLPMHLVVRSFQGKQTKFLTRHTECNLINSSFWYSISMVQSMSNWENLILPSTFRLWFFPLLNHERTSEFPIELFVRGLWEAKELFCGCLAWTADLILTHIVFSSYWQQSLACGSYSKYTEVWYIDKTGFCISETVMGKKSNTRWDPRVSDGCTSSMATVHVLGATMAAGHGRNEGMKTELNYIHHRHAFALPVQHVQCSDMMERAAATCVDPSPKTVRRMNRIARPL